MMYTYHDMKDKTKDGVLSEMARGLAKIGFYFETTLGVPFEFFCDWLDEYRPTNADRMHFYMKFRSNNPELFINTTTH